jgi:hypothetical protein
MCDSQLMPATATGVVISVDGPDAANVDRIDLRTNDGEVLHLLVGTLDLAGGGLPAPHLREHLVSGDPITVTYFADRDGFHMVRYTDAASQSPTGTQHGWFA